MYEYGAELIRVVDGDTIDMLIDLGFRAARVERLRLRGIDTPELRGGSDEDKKTARAAKAFVQVRLQMAKEIKIRTHKADSFGRWLADVFYKDSSGVWVDLATALLVGKYVVVSKW